MIRPFWAKNFKWSNLVISYRSIFLFFVPNANARWHIIWYFWRLFCTICTNKIECRRSARRCSFNTKGTMAMADVKEAPRRHFRRITKCRAWPKIIIVSQQIVVPLSKYSIKVKPRDHQRTSQESKIKMIFSKGWRRPKKLNLISRSNVKRFSTRLYYLTFEMKFCKSSS